MNSNIAVILTDKHRRILWVNDEFTELTGYSLGEVQGRKPSLLQGPNTEGETVSEIRKNLDNHVPFKSQITNYKKNGEEYLCRLVVHPVFDTENQLINFIAFEVNGSEVDPEDDLPLLNLDTKYQSSSLKGAEELKLFSRLKEVMESEKLFLDPDLSLRNVADRLATNTKYLSQVVNHYAGQNFQHFVNSYRINAIKKKILSRENPNLTLFGLAMQSGFKNKSTFYKVFKEIAGTTPKAFMKEARRSGSPNSV